jgi:hypothetical protein
VGLRIPPDYSDRIVHGERAEAQVLIDGSDSQVATTALSAVNLRGLDRSVRSGRAKAESLQGAAAREPQGACAFPTETMSAQQLKRLAAPLDEKKRDSVVPY